MIKRFVSEIKKFVKREELDTSLNKLHKNIYISKGTFSDSGLGTVEDFEWNHLDQAHRIYIHDAYIDALRIATTKDVAISLTSWNRLPIYIQVADMRIDRGLFYQTFTVFGLIFCFQIGRLTQKGEYTFTDVEWTTVSHKWLKMFHGPFNRRLLRLQKKQYLEDHPIRNRRAELRRCGHKFKTDEPDFINSNVLSDMVIFPELKEEVRFPLADLKQNNRVKIAMGPVEFFVLNSGPKIEVWPAVCPHEGAKMPETKFCEGVLMCPWHGRKFNSTVFEKGKSNSFVMGNLSLNLVGEVLVLKNVVNKIPPTRTIQPGVRQPEVALDFI
jgi:hypothetical protein